MGILNRNYSLRKQRLYSSSKSQDQIGSSPSALRILTPQNGQSRSAGTVFASISGLYVSNETSLGGEFDGALFSNREPVLVFLFRYSVVWLLLGGGMSSEGAKTVLIAAIISVVIRGDDGAPIAGLGVRGDVDDLMGEEDRVLEDVADSGSLFPITERIAYDRGAGNGVVEARTPVAGAGFSISGPKFKANAGVSGVFAHPSATDMMWIRWHDRRAVKAVGKIPKPCSALGIDRPAMRGRKTAKLPAACKRSETSHATRACSMSSGRSNW